METLLDRDYYVPGDAGNFLNLPVFCRGGAKHNGFRGFILSLSSASTA